MTAKTKKRRTPGVAGWYGQRQRRFEFVSDLPVETAAKLLAEQSERGDGRGWYASENRLRVIVSLESSDVFHFLLDKYIQRQLHIEAQGQLAALEDNRTLVTGIASITVTTYEGLWLATVAFGIPAGVVAFTPAAILTPLALLPAAGLWWLAFRTREELIQVVMRTLVTQKTKC